MSPAAGKAPGFDWRIPAFVVGTLVYLVVFYAADIRKLLALRWLLIPDVMVSDWMGGEGGQAGMADRLGILLAAGLILFVCYATGQLLVKRLLAAAHASRLERTLFSFGVGLNLWSLYTLAVGLAGFLQTRWVLFGPALLVAAWWALDHLRNSPRTAGNRSEIAAPPASDDTLPGDGTRRRAPDAGATTPLPEPAATNGRADAPSGWMHVVVAATVVFGLVILLGSMLPPWHFDVREYHLQVPKEWFLQGSAGFMPHNIYGNMPLGAEMHTILGMALMPGQASWWWGALVGKTIIGSYAILTGLMVYASGQRFLSARAGKIAACVFLSTPWIVHVSTAGLIEGAVAFYFMSTIHAIMIWYQVGRDDEANGERPAASSRAETGIILLAGFFAGSAVACKYPSLLFLVAPAWLFLVFFAPRTRPTSKDRRPLPFHRLPIGVAFRWRTGMLFLLAAGSAAGLWFGKNLVLTGNPTYPLLYEVFGGATRTPEKDAQWRRAHRTPEDADGRSYTVPQLSNSLSQVAWRSQFASPLLLPLAVAAWMSRRRSYVIGWTAFLLFGFCGWWILTHRLDRFLLPLLPVGCLLAGAGATWSAANSWRWFLRLFLVWAVLTNFLLVTSNEAGDNRYFVSLASTRVVSHPGHAYLNAHVEPGYRGLLVGDAQAFNVAVPVLYNTCFDDCWFDLLMRGRTTEERREILHRERISHILVDWYELNRYRSPGNYGYSDFVTPELLQSEFVATGLLRPVATDLVPEKAQMYEVSGWREGPAP